MTSKLSFPQEVKICFLITALNWLDGDRKFSVNSIFREDIAKILHRPNYDSTTIDACHCRTKVNFELIILKREAIIHIILTSKMSVKCPR